MRGLSTNGRWKWDCGIGMLVGHCVQLKPVRNLSVPKGTMRVTSMDGSKGKVTMKSGGPELLVEKKCSFCSLSSRKIYRQVMSWMQKIITCFYFLFIGENTISSFFSFFFSVISSKTQTQIFWGTRTHLLHCAEGHSYLFVKI